MSWIASAHEPRTRNNVPALRSDQGLIVQSDSNDPVTYDRINPVELEDEDSGALPNNEEFADAGS